MSDAVLNYLYTLFLSILSTFHRRDYLWASVAKVMEGRLPWTNWPWFLPWIMAVTSDSIWFELQLPFLSPFPLTNRHSLSTQQPQIRSDQISRSVTSDSLWPHESQHAKPPSLSPTPGVHWDSRPSSQWCHLAISSSVVPFSSCPQSLPASECFPMSQLFAWGGQSIGVSASASFLPKKSQGWSSEWTGWISLQSKGLSRVFSNTTLQKHQFFGTQPFSQSNSHIHTWPQEKL